MKNLFLFLSIVLLAACSTKQDELKLPSIVSDNMVLQQQKQVNLWGWSNPEASVTIDASWGATANATASPEGEWLAQIETPTFGGPYTITFKTGSKEITVTNVLIGEVWLCSGQSNMEMPMKGWPGGPIENSEEDIANANYPDIRMFTVKQRISLEPVDDCVGSWEVTTPETVGNFSATGYYYGLKLYKELEIPVGLIHSSWGGTPAESWTNLEFISKVDGFQKYAQELTEGRESYQAFMAFLASLKNIPMEDLPADAPYVDLDLNNASFIGDEELKEGWNDLEIPGLWEGTVLPGFDGVVWLAKEFEYNGDGNSLKLYLGPVDDMDVTYLNGVRIGSHELTGFYSVPRTYDIPEGVLKNGVNRILVKVIDSGGGGGIFGRSAPAVLNNEERIIELGGNWKFKPAAVFQNSNIYVFGDGEKSFTGFSGRPMNFDQNSATVLYNGMISPIDNFTIQGAIWYQGEANVGRGKQYESLFPTMISCWRASWNQGDFPFYFTQIAPYDYGPNSDESVSEVRFAQLKTLALNNTGMAVTMDVGNARNIHPAKKREVGERLALWALAKTYGMEEIVYSGPLYESASFNGNKVEVTFNNIGSGLKLTDNESYFEVAGSDNKFYKATAKVNNDKITVSSPKVKAIQQVRYAWSDDCTPNLFNVEGLPASPFIAVNE